jgi:hypothetical protein
MSTTSRERGQPVSYFNWQSSLLSFGVTLGSSVWLAISGALLLVRSHGLVGAVFLSGFAVLAVAAGTVCSAPASMSSQASFRRNNLSRLGGITIETNTNR